MKKIALLFFVLLAVLSFTSNAQTTTLTDTAYKAATFQYQYPVITVTKTTTNTVHDTIIKTVTVINTVHDTIIKTVTVINTVHDTIIKTVTVNIPCDTTPYIVKSMYVSPIDDWIANADARLTWAKREGVNELNLYARAYLTTVAKQPSLAAFVKKAKEQYGIKKVFVDYRLTTELPFWQTYCNTYKGTTSALNGLITEREPYITGDYAGFWPFLREGKAFAISNKLELAVYMGQPSTQGWDSIVFYADKVYLSLYITMVTWSNSTNGYNYVQDRWEYMKNSATKLGKVNFPVVYIISLEQTKWGAGNNFMGDWFTTHSFYGPTWDILLSRYNSNATTDILSRTDLIGSCMFYSKYGLLARP